MARKKWRQNRNYGHVHFRIQSDAKPFQYAACGRENFRIRKKNICGKKNFPIRVDMDKNCFRARSSTITSLTMVSPFLSRRIVLLSRLKMCILIGFSTEPSLSVPQWNSLNESLFQVSVLRRVLRFNFRVQLPFFLELIINWHCCCLNCFSETDCFHNNRSSVDFRQSKN